MERIAFKDIPQGLMNAMLQVQNYIGTSGLDEKLLTLMRMRVSQINNCAYCLDMHYKEGIQEGQSALRLISLSAWRETHYYTPEEQAVLEFAEKLTKMPQDEHSDDIHEELLKYFTKQQIANLTVAIAQINSWNRITRSFGTTPGNYQVKQKAAVN